MGLKIHKDTWKGVKLKYVKLEPVKAVFKLKP